MGDRSSNTTLFHTVQYFNKREYLKFTDSNFDGKKNTNGYNTDHKLYINDINVFPAKSLYTFKLCFKLILVFSFDTINGLAYA